VIEEPRDKVIQIVTLINGGKTAYDGQFVVEYNASRTGREQDTGRLMMCHLVATPNVDEAARYTTTEAWELWKSVDTRHPVRPDGKPNRPFTAFTINVCPPDKALPTDFITDLRSRQENL
jgi:hypothetical protein